MLFQFLKSFWGSTKTFPLKNLGRGLDRNHQGIFFVTCFKTNSPPWCWLEFPHVVTHEVPNFISALTVSPTPTLIYRHNVFHKMYKHLCHSPTVDHRCHDHDHTNGHLPPRPHKDLPPMHAKTEFLMECIIKS